MTISAGPLRDDTAPCVGCGLCCDGTLYSRARAEPGEEARLRALGLELTTVEGKRYFRLPCSQHECGRCTIYETRFAKCRSFRCALLRRYQSGDVTLEDAREKVETAKQLADTVAATDPDAVKEFGRARIRSRLEIELANADQSTRSTIAARLLSLVALDTYLERWFLNKRARTRS